MFCYKAFSNSLYYTERNISLLSSEPYSCSLKQCLELFTEPETLSENDAW